MINKPVHQIDEIPGMYAPSKRTPKMYLVKKNEKKMDGFTLKSRDSNPPPPDRSRLEDQKSSRPQLNAETITNHLGRTESTDFHPAERHKHTEMFLCIHPTLDHKMP